MIEFLKNLHISMINLSKKRNIIPKKLKIKLKGSLTNKFRIFLTIFGSLIARKYLNQFFFKNLQDEFKHKQSNLTYNNSVTEDELIQIQIKASYPQTSKFSISRRFEIFAERFILSDSCEFSYARAYSVASMLKPLLNFERLESLNQSDSNAIDFNNLSILCLGCRDSLEVSFAKRYFRFEKKPLVKGLDLISDNKDVIVGDILNIPFEKESFDIVISSHSLEHVSDYNLALNEMFRVTKKNGYVCLEVPINWTGKKSKIRAPIRSDDDTDLWDFVDDDLLKELIEATGLKVVCTHINFSARYCRLIAKKK